MKRRAIIWGIAAIGLVGLYGVIDRAVKRNAKLVRGYCFEQERFLTDKEIIDAAVAGFIVRLNNYPNSLSGEDKHPDLQFSSVEDFYNKNPYCCYPVADPPRRQVRTGVIAREEYGRPVYRPVVRLMVGREAFSAGSMGVSLCGEYLDIRGRIKFRPSSISSVKVRPNDKRPDRRK